MTVCQFKNYIQEGVCLSRGSIELTNLREKEIIDAFEELYQTISFRNISMKDIENKISITRSSIYNYFNTKEEIFLALLKKEFLLWQNAIFEILSNKSMNAIEFSSAIAKSLENRKLFFKVISVNHFEIEENSRIEKLADFQKVYYDTMNVFKECLNKFFPNMSDLEKQNFQNFFFIFLYGINSHVIVSQNQRKALNHANIEYHHVTIYDTIYNFMIKFLEKE